MPRAVVASFANYGVQAPPVVRSDRIGPAIKVAQNDAHRPKGAGVRDMGQIRDRLLDAAVCFFGARPGGILREPVAAGAAGCVQVADHHVVKQDVVEPPGAQPAPNQMRMHVQHRHFGQRFLQLLRDRTGIHDPRSSTSVNAGLLSNSAASIAYPSAKGWLASAYSSLGNTGATRYATPALASQAATSALRC